MKNIKVSEIEDLKKSIEHLGGYTIKHADARCGKRIALVFEKPNGTYCPATEYMSYKEMYYFLRGYLFNKLYNRII